MWRPDARSVVRASYSQSLGGANLDQSVRLEPTQLAGFTQAYRNVMPGSLVGGIGGARFETTALSLDHRFGSGTYVALSGELLHSTAGQTVGAFSRSVTSPDGSAVQLGEQFAFTERSLDFSAHQLLGDYFSIGARYRLTEARLATSFPQLKSSVDKTRSDLGGLLQLVALNASCQLPCGLFASAEGQWWRQELQNDLAAVPGDQFWQANVFVGYRSPRRHVEATVGILNITGQDFRLHPINLYPDLSRGQTFAAKLQINF